jgi:hypothetical protein
MIRVLPLLTGGLLIVVATMVVVGIGRRRQGGATH